MHRPFLTVALFFFNDPATTEIYTLSLHDALPIWHEVRPRRPPLRLPQQGEADHRDRRRRRRRGPDDGRRLQRPGRDDEGDRKSTRLNSSHVEISYAVFCLKKKKMK